MLLWSPAFVNSLLKNPPNVILPFTPLSKDHSFKLFFIDMNGFNNFLFTFPSASTIVEP